MTVGSTFTAPTQATVLYTDGTNALFDVTWNSDELAKVDTKTAGKTFTVNGKVTVEGTTYDAVMNVEVLDASGLVQEVPEGSLGSVDFDANWQFYLATRTPKVADGGFAAAGIKDAGDYTTDEIVDPSFNDLEWRTVDVPHDFSIEGEKVKSLPMHRLIWKADLAITVRDLPCRHPCPETRQFLLTLKAYIRTALFT